jgi:hypothetical protein
MKQLEKLTKRKGFKYKKDYILKLWKSIQFWIPNLVSNIVNVFYNFSFFWQVFKIY